MIKRNQAQEAFDQGEVPVGCVFVHQELGILASGSNQTNASLNVNFLANFFEITMCYQKFNQHNQ